MVTPFVSSPIKFFIVLSAVSSALSCLPSEKFNTSCRSSSFQVPLTSSLVSCQEKLPSVENLILKGSGSHIDLYCNVPVHIFSFSKLAYLDSVSFLHPGIVNINSDDAMMNNAFFIIKVLI